MRKEYDASGVSEVPHGTFLRSFALYSTEVVHHSGHEIGVPEGGCLGWGLLVLNWNHEDHEKTFWNNPLLETINSKILRNQETTETAKTMRWNIWKQPLYQNNPFLRSDEKWEEGMTIQETTLNSLVRPVSGAPHWECKTWRLTHSWHKPRHFYKIMAHFETRQEKEGPKQATWEDISAKHAALCYGLLQSGCTPISCTLSRKKTRTKNARHPDLDLGLDMVWRPPPTSNYSSEQTPFPPSGTFWTSPPSGIPLDNPPPPGANPSDPEAKNSADFSAQSFSRTLWVMDVRAKNRGRPSLHHQPGHACRVSLWKSLKLYLKSCLKPRAQNCGKWPVKSFYATEQGLTFSRDVSARFSIFSFHFSFWC